MLPRRLVAAALCLAGAWVGCAGGGGGIPAIDAGNPGSSGSGGGTPDAGSRPDAGSVGSADAGPQGGPDGGSTGTDGGAANDNDAGVPDAGTGAVASSCPASFDPPPGPPAPPPAVSDDRAGELVQPAWEIRPPPGWILQFFGTVDSGGNLYWLEFKDGTSTLASATIDGEIRFRAATAEKDGAVALLLAGDTLVWLAVEGIAMPVASGYSTATGKRLWRRELLPVIQGWFRDPVNNTGKGAFNGAAVSGTAVVIALGSGSKTESGYVAVDGRTGSVLWVERTTDADTVMMASRPVAAEDGTLFGAQIQGDRHTDLLRFSAAARPALLFSGPRTVMYTLVSAPEPVLFVLSTNDFFTPLHLEVRCQGDGALIAQFAPGNFFLGDAAGTAWLATNDGTVSRYELRTGSLAMRVQVPWAIKLISSTGIVAVEQRIEYPLGQSTARTQGPPTLHVVAPDGTDVFRRSLPLEPEAYNGIHSASFRDRILLEGEFLPAVRALGVIRAIDVPGWSSVGVER